MNSQSFDSGIQASCTYLYPAANPLVVVLCVVTLTFWQGGKCLATKIISHGLIMSLLNLPLFAVCLTSYRCHLINY